MLRVFIGFDERQPIAYTVAALSVQVNSSKPVAVTPLIYRQLPPTRTGLTSFTFCRYLVPYLCNYEGNALFMDADVLCMGDITELPWDSKYAVSVVPHDTVMKRNQRVSVRFERPSVMLFNNTRCTALTPEYITTGKPQSLEWADSVGELPPEWNYLVGYNTGGGAKLAHFTQGIPCFDETKDDEYAKEWMEMLRLGHSTVSWEEIMGPSVHAQWKRPA
jgi:hypothetical protein